MDSFNYTTDCVAVLEILNAETTNHFIPVIIYLGIAMVLGVIGNFFVSYIYFYKFERKSTHIFIVALSVCDFLACAICIPIEIMTLKFTFTFHNDVLCRFIGSIIALAVINSGLTVFIITVDRYMLICRPIKTTNSLKKSKKLIVLIIIISVIICIPASFVYTKHNRKARQCGNIGAVCALSGYLDGSVYSLVYYLLIVIICFFMFSLIMILYFMIGVRIRKIYKTKKIKLSTFSQAVTSNPIDETRESSSMYSNQIARRKAKLHPSRINLILFIISVIWIMSYIPHFIGVFWKLFTENFEDTTSPSEQLLYHFMVLSYYINCAINPYIYGLFSQQFRNELRNLFRHIFQLHN